MPDSPRQFSQAPAKTPRLQQLAGELREGLRHHGLLLASAAAVMVFGNLVSGVSGYAVPLPFLGFLERYVVFAGLVVFTAAALWTFLTYLLVERRPGPHRAFLAWLRGEVLSGQRLLNGLFGMAAILMLVIGFLQAKNSALRIEGHHLDAALSAADRIVHLGILPQDWLQPLLGHALPTRLLDMAYLLWQPVMLAAFFLGAFQARRSLARHRFLLAMIITFGVGGSLLAVALASGGPVFYGALTGLPDPYAAHMAFLQGLADPAPLYALSAQQMIWSSRGLDHGVALISAMPSMHVALAALIVLATWRFGWQARLASLAFAALILLGSIHLGWHYAIDGYAGILIAWVAWAVALPVSRWYLDAPQVSR